MKRIYLSLLALLLISYPGWSRERVFIGVTGGSGSGKSTLARHLIQELRKLKPSLQEEELGILNQDHYFLPDQQPPCYHVNGSKNFDHPSAMEFELMRKHLVALKQGERVTIPQYNYVSSSRTSNTEIFGPYKILVFEGIHTLHDETIRGLLDYKVFVDFPDEGRLNRRLQRDVVERGNSYEMTLKFYQDFVRPMYEQFIAPMKVIANKVVSGEATRTTAPAEIAQEIIELLEQKQE